MPQLKRQHCKDTQNVSKKNTRTEKEETKYSDTKLNSGNDDKNENETENKDFTVEHDQNVSETFNYEKRVIEDGTTVAGCSSDRNNISKVEYILNGPLASDKVNGARDFNSEHTYENLSYDLNGSKEILLHKFFRGADRSDAIYANLCRGCGYGVFEANGEFCYFCASIVNGVRDTPASIGSLSAENLDFVNNSSNVYENICETCYAIYSSDECVNCATDLKTKNGEKCEKKSRNGLIIDSKNEQNKKTVKLTKSKSFNKRTEKRSIFQGLIGSLKRAPKPVKSGNSNSAARLEIIHNVDGFESVFRTQETFDLQRICELKRTQTSSSDQHIYGRLKCTEAQNNSQNHSASTQTLPLLQLTELQPKVVTVSETSLHRNEDDDHHHHQSIETRKASKTATIVKKLTGKRPRISKPRLLRAITIEPSNSSIEEKAAVENQQKALYLPDSVCHWMTSLRREVHNYKSCFGETDGGDDTIGLCNPKSIPAKNSLLTYYSTKASNGILQFDGDSLLNDIGAIKDISILLSTELTNYLNIENLQATTTTTKTATPTTTTPTVVISTKNVTKFDSKKPLNNDVSSCCCCTETNSSNDDGTVTLREQHELTERITNKNNDSDSNESSPVALAQMVDEFKRNLVAKKYKKEMSKDSNEMQQNSSDCSSDNSKERNNSESKVSSSMRTMEIENRDHLRQELRARRQAIYLKNDDCKVNNDSQSKSSKNSSKNAQNNDVSSDKINNNNSNGDGNADEGGGGENFSMKIETLSKLELEVELGSKISTESPVSRRRAVEACVSLNRVGPVKYAQNNRKRCGIYEPNVDSTFVVDILNDFDAFLQNEDNEIEAKEEEKDEQEIEYQELNDPNFITPSSSLSVLSSHSQIVEPYAVVAQQDSNHQKCSIPASIHSIFDFVKFYGNLHLSRSLNNIIISYPQPLHAFLLATRVRYPRVCENYTQSHLVRKFWRFHAYCMRKLTTIKFRLEKCNQIENVSTIMAAPYDACNCDRNSVKIIVQQLEIKCSNSNSKTNSKTTTKTNAKNSIKKFENSSATNETYMTNLNNNFHEKTSLVKPVRAAPKRPEPPQVPLRNPKTSLSARNNIKTAFTPPVPIPIPPIKRESLNNTTNYNNNKMTIQTMQQRQQQQNKIQKHTSNDSEENIYQPIWKFKTVGEVQERYQTDVDYYEIGNGIGNSNSIGNHTTTGFNNQTESQYDSLPAVIISNDVEDHGEWETDDEFMFTTEMMSDKISLDAQSNANAEEVNSLNSSTALNSTQSSSNSLSGSTVAGFSSSSCSCSSCSTATISSAISSSLTHHLFRNIGIFYSLSEPKLRAIIYDYDRVHASAYFAKRSFIGAHHKQQQQQQQQQSQQRQPNSTSPCSHDSIESNANDSGIGKSLQEERLPTPPPRTTSAALKSPANIPKKFSESVCCAGAGVGGGVGVGCQSTAKTLTEPLLPDSVQAWKFMLLDVNYLEDEEDMIVSETEILRSQEIKEDIDTRQTQQLNILQRFKSASFGNLVDLPNEDDKKSIAERMRNKLQRGVFKLNVRSPKSDKKNRGIFRRAEATSLYLEDGMKPKYPIFGAPLEQLELDHGINHNVPRFVVDCVAYIEQKDCIQQEGIYRASGNKVSIEELKQKLSESYIYDPKLLINDDIHTLTSLLKLFFRELGAPLIPQETYERLGPNLCDAAAIETMREAFDDMREPNRSTLKFLIRHLTNVAAYSSQNRMPASNLAIVWGPCIMSANQIEFDIGRMNTLAKVLIENYSRIFNESERLVA